MGGLSGDSEIEITAGSILVGMSILSMFLGCVALYLIHIMGRWNGYILLIYAVTFFQLVNDLSYFFLVNYNDPYCYAIYQFLNSLGGISVTLWINVISFLVLYTVAFLKTIDIKKNFYRLSLGILAVSLTVAIFDVITYYNFPNSNVVNWIYFWIRIGSIFLNVIAYWIVWFLLQPRFPNQLSCYFTGRKRAAQRIKTTDLLIILTNRLKYYPLVQVTTRAAAAWWDVVYGFSPNSWDGNYTIEKQVSQFLYDVTNPFAGIGFFLVFLAVQPSAYQQFQLLVVRCWNTCCCKAICPASWRVQRDICSASVERSSDGSLLRNSLLINDAFAAANNAQVYTPFRGSHSFRGSSVEMSGGESSSFASSNINRANNASTSSDSGHLDLDEDIVWDEINRRILGSESSAEKQESIL